ncbi:MAG: hypothetical protein QOH71_1739 [Blastocatellia bacterium]|jgi:hypothetical protein|nr:hypothetical protein [Blastocatellia bacterium]
MGREIRQIKQNRFATISGVAATVGGVAVAVGGTLVFSHFWPGLVALLGGGSITAIPTIVSKRRKITSEVEDARLRAAEELVAATGESDQRALATLVELTHHLIDLPSEHDLRVTLMRVDLTKKPAELAQIARCAPSSKAAIKATPTSMTVHQGVAGRCYRTTAGKVESIVVNLPQGDFVGQMVEFGFEKEEAMLLEKRGSFVCTPIIDSSKKVIAVLCVDTAPSNVLKPEHISMAERVTPFFSKFLTADKVSGGSQDAQPKTGT